jgi:hypothetical protein
MNRNNDIETVVEWAIEEFLGPGRFGGNLEECLSRNVHTFSTNHDQDNFAFNDDDLAEIRTRLTQSVTTDPDIDELDISDISHIDDSITTEWFDKITTFPKWEKIKSNWEIGHESGRLDVNAVAKIHSYSSHILQHSNNPKGNETYLWKGLVVGNVQSGKTATFIGVIGKAIDVGYRVILVLSGRMNSLRYQTQARINSQIIGKYNDGASVDFDKNIFPVTSLDIDGDFGSKKNGANSPRNIAQLLKASPERTIIAVVKKHWSPLSKFNDWADQIASHFPAFRNSPFLIIDDEMDEAGPNTGGNEVDNMEIDDRLPDPETEEDWHDEPSVQVNPETGTVSFVDEPSTTNQSITKLLKQDLFRKRMYLGFTATPYAIILHRRRNIESPEYSEYGPDIFPDNYLLVLKDSDNYCGGDIFTGRTEVVVRDMEHANGGKIIYGKELLHLPASTGISGIFEVIPTASCCPTCAETLDSHGVKTHHPGNGPRGHCRNTAPRKGYPIDAGDASCRCTCHSRDEIHKVIPTVNDIIPTPEEISAGATLSYAEMVPSLRQAIVDFILAGAARAQRGFAHKPCTMMINAHSRSAVHLNLKELVYKHVCDLNNLFCARREELILEQFRARWINSFTPTIRAFDGTGSTGPEDLVIEGSGKTTENPNRLIAHAKDTQEARMERLVKFEEIRPFIRAFISEIAQPENHRVLNSMTSDIVDYDKEPSVKAIIHGGYNLGRGLTFKGLTTTYMLRSHGDLSGLMQMQRWCGYRGEVGGERILDLMRIYLTEQDRQLFRRILAIETKNRFQLGLYIKRDKSPEEITTILEQDPDTPLMSAAKAGALRNVGGILSGREKTQRTFRFDADETEDIRYNQTLLSNFLTDISAYLYTGHKKKPDLVYRDVPTQFVHSLLSKWKMVDTQSFRKDDVQAWITRLRDWTSIHPNDPQLTHWTIYIPSRQLPSLTAYDTTHVDGFDARSPIRLENGLNINPYQYTLDRDSDRRLKTIKSPSFGQIDSDLFFDRGSRPETHGLMLISSAIHPLNRINPGGKYDNVTIPTNIPPHHDLGKWPHLLAVGLWFPCTDKLNTQLVTHGDAHDE